MHGDEIRALRRLEREQGRRFMMASDPVGSGVAASHTRPCGNVTGFTNFEPSIAGKWLELLKEIAPSVRGIAIIVHPETPASMMFQPAAEGADAARAPAFARTRSSHDRPSSSPRRRSRSHA